MKEQLLEIWQRFDVRQRRTLIAVISLTVIMLSVVVHRSMQPEWVLLYGGLEPEVAASVVDELSNQKIKYTLEKQGTAIMVEREDLYELRLQLANKGLPGNGGIGFEIFDHQSLPGTAFSNTVNLQRALQGELSRSINCVDEIVASRVHLVLPKDSLYGNESKASASVVVTLRPGATLSQGQIQGLTNLVAYAVEGLEPGQVTIVDQGGNMLSAGGDGTEGAGAGATWQLETRREFEEGLRTRLQSMLDAVVGENKAIVRVQADINFDTEQIQSEIVSEPEGENGGLKSDHIVEETYEGSNKPAGLAAGVSANTEDALLAGARGGGGQYLSREQTREYELSREKVEKTIAGGTIQRLTIATVVDEDIQGATLDKIREIIEAAGGYDEQRGDVVTIQSLPLAARQVAEATVKEADKVAADAARADQIAVLTKYGSGLAAVLVLGMAIMLGTKQVRNAMMPQVEHIDIELPQLPEMLVQAEEIGDVDDGEDRRRTGEPDLAGLSDDELNTGQLADFVRKLADERPEAVVKQLQRWLAGM